MSSSFGCRAICLSVPPTEVRAAASAHHSTSHIMVHVSRPRRSQGNFSFVMFVVRRAGRSRGSNPSTPRLVKVVQIRGSIENDQIRQYQVTVKVGFTLEED